VQQHYEGHWKGWALKIETFLGPKKSRFSGPTPSNKDVKQKAAIFDDAVLKEFMVSRRNKAYWLVRQAICIVSFFSGLRLQECMDLELEKIQRGKEGYIITHNRVKQRSDKLESRFIVPETGRYAAQLALYLFKVNNQLKHYQGRVSVVGKMTTFDL
jgi:hypothetical protein